MTTTLRLSSALGAAVLLLAACNRDAQTDKEIRTESSTGEASTSISGDSADKRGEALVRVVNATAVLPTLTVRADEMHALPPVEYGKVTPYQPIDRNWVTFQIGGTSGAFEPLVTNREMLTDGHRYTIIVMRDRNAEGFETRILRDEISSDITRAGLRVIHAANGTGEVNVVARGGETWFEGINYGSEAGFKAVMPWLGAVEFRSEDGNRLLASLAGMDLRAGRSYTVVLARGSDGKLKAFWFEDSPV